MPALKDISGKTFGKLSVIERTQERVRGSVVWLCKCSCGTVVNVPSDRLVKGDTRSCGCLLEEWRSSGLARTTHGGRKTPLYWVWCTMKARCYNKKNHKYPRYGGRGISVCGEWKEDFAKFRVDMEGTYKKGLQIDRIDNNKGYSKGNCRWVTSTINNNNRYY